jgi:hypothetical protein
MVTSVGQPILTGWLPLDWTTTADTVLRRPEAPAQLAIQLDGGNGEVAS